MKDSNIIYKIKKGIWILGGVYEVLRESGLGCVGVDGLDVFRNENHAHATGGEEKEPLAYALLLKCVFYGYVSDLSSEYVDAFLYY